jgi:D-beta-D-heptose 7-phosphate kinase/D-beta-D-heptose 1-phosphate adenosyltransferase
VRRLKGAGRPINGLDDRAHVLAALSAVDLIVPFDDDVPTALVRAVRPDVFVKGGDYTVERLPEAAAVREGGGEVRILPYVEDRSTTSIIARIHARAPGAAALGSVA